MPNFALWHSDPYGRIVSTEDRAVRAWNRINDKPSEITVRRPGISDFTQVVRIEYFQGQALRGDTNPLGNVAKQTLIIYGVLNHPDTNIADTDLQVGDRFIYEYREFVIQTTLNTIGEIQAQAEATT